MQGSQTYSVLLDFTAKTNIDVLILGMSMWHVVFLSFGQHGSDADSHHTLVLCKCARQASIMSCPAWMLFGPYTFLHLCLQAPCTCFATA